MTVETPPPSTGSARPTPRPGKRKTRPRGGFWKGAALGILTVIPLCAVAVWTLARMGIGNRDATMIDSLRMASLFAGVAAVLTAGGVGRLTAQASVERRGGRRRAAAVGARTMAAGGAALTIITAIPLGELPMHPWGWVALGVAGAFAGGIAGVLIGIMCGGPLPRLAELGVWRIEPIEWTRDLFGLDDRRERTDEAPGAAPRDAPVRDPAEPPREPPR